MARKQKSGFRLVTRSDFDGMVSAALLKEIGLIEDIVFVHPKDMQDGNVQITDQDIITNLPFVEGCHLAFVHHSSESQRRSGAGAGNLLMDPESPSASRMVYKHYGDKHDFPDHFEDMVAAADKVDMAQFTREEILHPTGWVLLNFLIDNRTGLNRFNNFRESNYQFLMDLIEGARKGSVESLLEMDSVKQRAELYFNHETKFDYQLQRSTSVYRNLLVLNLQNESVIFSGNRFKVYALFPQCNISIHVVPGHKDSVTVFAVGKSIINRTSKLDIGALMLEYGGGGHRNAGTCQVPSNEYMEILNELILKIIRHDQRHNYRQY